MSSKKIQILGNINADTVDGKHASEFATVTQLNDYETKINVDSKLENVTNVISKKADSVHNHTIDDIENLQVSLNSKSNIDHNHDSDYADITHGHAISDVTNLQTQLDGKASSSHNHDTVYASKTHSHAISDVTNLQTTLDSKASATHNHDSDYDAKGSASAVQTNLNVVDDKLDTHTSNTDVHVTTSNKSNWNTAYTHSQSAHARTDATKVEDSTTNGNILINGSETNIYTHPNSGVTAGTYKSVTVNAQGHITAGTNPTTLAGYGITDAETKGTASNALASAKEYTDSVASGKANTSHNHDSAYDAKGSASNALASAKSYADSAATTAANNVKNDLLNGAGGAYDTLKELGDLIDNNADAIGALETVAAGKADKSHTHTIANVTGLQGALDGKAASSHGTHVSYSTTAPVMDGTASVGSASTVARSDHKHPTDTSRASKTEFDSHAANTTVHITSAERSNWNAAKTHADSAHAPSNAEVNQNAFSNVIVGSTTIAADNKTDSLTFVAGSNVTITPDATNDKITISSTDTNTWRGIQNNLTSTSTTDSLSAAQGTALKSLVDGKQATITGAATTITSSNLTASRALISNSSGKVTVSDVTSTELSYLDGVTSNIQTQLNGKAPTSHASTATTYGIGTSTNYGHVKLSDSTSTTSVASAGVAATPTAVKAAYDLAGTKVNKSGDTMTGALTVNAKMQATTVNVAGAVTLAYDSTNKCLNFNFA